MFGLPEIIRVNQLAVERQKENTGGRLDKTGLINCLKQPGSTTQCSRCQNYIVCLEISQAINS